MESFPQEAVDHHAERLVRARRALDEALPIFREAERQYSESVEVARTRRLDVAKDDVAEQIGGPGRDSFSSLHDALQYDVPRLICACTPSVIEQPFADDLRASDTSVSYPRAGNPIGGTKLFGRINSLIAKYYGVEHAWALVNGSTGANWMIARWLSHRLATDEVVLVARGSHVSVPQALTDFGVEWRYIDCDYLPDYESVLPPTAARIADALERWSKTGAIWVNGPSYEGVVLDTRGIRDLLDARALSIPLIVDEAWGSHFPGLSDLHAYCAIRNGADVANSSTHKQAGGLQGTAVLVLAPDSCVTPTELDAAVKALYSTSPSFHLLASIEATYARLIEQPDAFDPLVARAGRLRSRLELPLRGDVSFFDSDATVRGNAAVVAVDPLKVTVGVHELAANGYEIAAALVERDVIVEKEGLNTVTLLVTHQLTDQDIDHIASRFAEVVADLGGRAPARRRNLEDAFAVAAIGNASSPSQAARQAAREGRAVPLNDAVDRRAGERVAVYPPGIPLFVEGQTITHDHVQFIASSLKSGAHLHRSSGSRGRDDPDGHVIVIPD